MIQSEEQVDKQKVAIVYESENVDRIKSGLLL